MNRAQRRAVAKKHGKTPAERKRIQQSIRLRDEAEERALATAALDAAGFEVVTPRVIVPGQGEG